MIIVYVEDFKVAAKAGDHDRLWAAIRGVIDMDAESIDGRFLGCTHERYNTTAAEVQDLLNNHPLYHPRTKGGASPTDEESTDAAAYRAQHFDHRWKVVVVVYNMERFGNNASPCCVNSRATTETRSERPQAVYRRV